MRRFNLGAAEGVNVLVERHRGADNTWSYGISNVEYTELERLGISDEPLAPGSAARPPHRPLSHLHLTRFVPDPSA